jgi:hypothetical protein
MVVFGTHITIGSGWRAEPALSSLREYALFVPTYESPSVCRPTGLALA